MSESTSAALTSVPGTFVVSLVVGIAWLGLNVLVFRGCHDRLTRRELLASVSERSAWRRFYLAAVALLAGKKALFETRGPRALGKRWSVRAVAAFTTILLSMQVTPTHLDERGHAVNPRIFLSTPAGNAPSVSVLPGTVLMSAKDGLAAGLAWCWGGAALAGTLASALVRLAVARTDFFDAGASDRDMSAFACGLAMTLTAAFMMWARYLFEVRQHDAMRALLEPPRARGLNPVTRSLGLPGDYSLLSSGHPMDRLPRWLLVALLGGGASIGSQVLSGLVWLIQVLWWPAACCEASCSVLDPICNVHPKNLLLSFTAENTLSYLGVNTVAFFIIVYVMLPREGRAMGFGWRSIANLIEGLFNRAPLNPGRSTRWGHRFRPWLEGRGTGGGAGSSPSQREASVAGASCLPAHAALRADDSAANPIEVMTKGLDCLMAHVAGAHQEVVVFGGHSTQHQAILKALASEAELQTLDVRSVIHEQAARQKTFSGERRMLGFARGEDVFPGDPRRLVIVVDPALACGATYLPHLELDDTLPGPTTIFSVYLHRDGSPVVSIHEAMEQLISDARDGSYERVRAESEAVPALESSFPPPPREVSASTFPPSGSMSSFPPPTTSTPPPVAADGSPEPGADQRPPI